MPKNTISKTAFVNLQMLTQLGVPEAVLFSNALQLEDNPLSVFAHIPFARRLPLCISTISEVLYESANDLIFEAGNPTILDIACGYSPRVLLMAPLGFTYIGADLPDVADDLEARKKDILPPSAEVLAGYKTLDATNQEQMESVLGALREPITVVTQGLLTYLTLEEKAQLCEGVRSLLERDGGCWIIPDTDPQNMLMDAFRAVLGDVATGVVKNVYQIVDKLIGRDRSKMGWQTSEEIEDALVAAGFKVRSVPLYRPSMKLHCLEQADAKVAERLVACWEQKRSMVVTLA